MALQTTTNINVDFYDKKYILINAKQFDKNSRFLSITCYNRGNLFPLYSSEYSAYVRYKKPDNKSVFNACEITRKGEILVELTEQMLASAGICYVDLVIVDNKGDVKFDINTGEIIAIENSAILSSMVFCIDVSETAIDNSVIESTHEFNILNEALQKIDANYQDVILSAKSWTVGGTGKRYGEDKDNTKYYYDLSKSYSVGDAGGIRTNENTDNAKYYYGESKIIYENLGTVLVYKGIIEYSDLKTVEKRHGYVYCISNEFVTDNTFFMGSGQYYPAGTSVYYSSDGWWTCFHGSTPIATVDEVKNLLGIE